MKRIATQKNSVLKRIGINIPFVLIAALMLALFGGGLLLAFYAIASIFAFNSAMICLILLGAGTIAIGAGLGLICLFKKYYDFYNKKMGWEFPDKPKKEEKTVSYEGKNTIKKYLTLPNIALGVLAIGAIFTIISAALGSINRDDWQRETSAFLTQDGYYESAQYRPLKHPLLAQEVGSSDISQIEINLVDKEAVIIYSEDKSQLGFADFEYYEKFVNQISISRTKDGKLIVNENTAPKITDTTIKKLFFFMFKDFYVEKQVKIILPLSKKENIKIVGDESKIIYAQETISSENIQQ